MNPRFFAVAVLSFLCLAGCGGGGSTSTGGGGNTQTPDMGTLSTMSDSVVYTLTNVAGSMTLGISAQSQTAGAALALEASSASSTDEGWHVIPMGNNQYDVENMLTHQVVGISNASTSAGAQALQWADNGTNDHLWSFYLLKDGNYLVKNVNSGFYLEDANSGTTSAATIDQGARATSGTGCSCQEWTLAQTANPPYPSPNTVRVSYTAPDSANIGIHDPSMILTGVNYDLFSTHGLIHEHQSQDMSTFADAGYALPALPGWTATYLGSSGDLWAPDISLHNGQYWLYYAASSFGSANSAIGLATSSSGSPGTFVDSGAPVYTSANCSGSNAIDPASVTDSSGNSWLVFGSWSNGIQIVPVNNSTGVPTGAACTQLAAHPTGTGIEGSYLYPHGGYYYLFASIDNCCQGTASTYRIIVGRSTSITGPYTDRGGLALTSGGGTILLSAHGNVNGPGGETVFTGATGPILVYHYYDGNNAGNPALGLNAISWTADGWPYVQ
ncbi:MAG TPA: family 43 glycosylhydrolase [Terracidiphilus sp.]|nr:family 43 glycosylhydrolase [Terracidiphilus sp.]